MGNQKIPTGWSYKRPLRRHTGLKCTINPCGQKTVQESMVGELPNQPRNYLRSLIYRENVSQSHNDP